MQLDRNANKDGRGKYALIKIRQLVEADYKAIIAPEGQGEYIGGEPIALVPRRAITLGSESPGDQFFVMKYKDRFALKGMIGYRDAVMEYVEKRQRDVTGMIERGEALDHNSIQEAIGIMNECRDLLEYAAELQAEIEQLQSLHGTNAVQTPN